MSDKEKMRQYVNLESLKRELERHGISPTFQRLKILEYLRKSKSHPTVEMIYEALSKDIPTISKATIYNTLHIFARKGIVAELSICEEGARFDANTEPHAHFRCVKCGNIYDVDFMFERIDEIHGHKVFEIIICLKGICRNCAHENRAED
ncbi:MAG: transcriptional repressor [Canidatus Methanoxibalbensis ujae]|nr:transcriptional repressor [Candidatus Methanoxibalbensis ujae]